jgi:hypothetical protein
LPRPASDPRSGVDDPFPDAALPEAIISGVVLAGAAAAALRVSHAWGGALAATLFAILGFLVGLRFTLFGGRSVVVGDVVYHLVGLLVLVVIAGLPLSARGRAALGKDAGTHALLDISLTGLDNSNDDSGADA